MNRRRALIVAAVVVAMAPLGHPSVAGASPETASEVAPAVVERAPTAVEGTAPWTGTARGVRLGRDAGQGEAQVGPEPGVDAETYRREKAAAVWAPAPAPGQRAVPVTAAGAAAVPAAALPTLFNGLDQPTSGGFSPPDTIVGKSPTRVLEATNSAIRLTNTAGTNLQTRTLVDFFGADAANGSVVDPKVFYDVNSTNDRFYVTGIQVAGRDDANAANDVSRIWVAVSRSTDPTDLNAAGWCRYNLNGIRNAGTADASFADRPEIGVGLDSFSFAANQFRFSDRGLTFDTLRVWNKDTASNNAAACPTVTTFTFQISSTIGDFTRFNVVPAQHYTAPSSFAGTTNPAYYMGTTRGSSSQYHVLRVRNVASGSPTLTSLTLTDASYAIPPSSTQPGSAVVVDTGDNRVTHVAARGNTVAGIFTTSCNFTAGTANESCERTPTVTVGQNAAGGLTATMTENTFAGYNDNIFAHHASIALNSSVQAGSTWQFSGTSFFLSAEARIKTAGTWAGVSTYAAGACALPESSAGSGSARSGDYAGAQSDPSDASRWWLAGEQAVTIAGSCQWRTRVALLTP
jgi:hypothetical protein